MISSPSAEIPNPILLFGYAEANRKIANSIISQTASPSDTLRVGPSIKIAEIREAIQWASLSPVDASSTKRVLYISMGSETRQIQSTLLSFLESDTLQAQVIITSISQSRVLPTIRSRCHVQVSKPGDFGQRVKDLSDQGLGFSYAATAAEFGLMGIQIDEIPSEHDISMSNSVLEASQRGDVQLAMQLATGRTITQQSAIRLRLKDKNMWSSLLLSYEFPQFETVQIYSERIK